MITGAKPNILEAVGGCPIVKLNSIGKHLPDVELYVKLEYLNPGGSIKDRIGIYMLDRAKENGDLKPGGTIIEGTSGNTGVGLAMWANIHGYKCIFVLADKQSKEKIDNLKAYGAKVVVCPTDVEPEDPRSYYSVSKKLAQTIPDAFYVNQYDNLYNRETHYKWTAPEIHQMTKGDFDTFVATVGTGGTITGCSRYFKEHLPHVKTVGIDCEGSIVAQYARTGDTSGAHSYVLEGVGEDFIPENYDFEVIDDWEIVGDKTSFLMTRRLLAEEGIYAGGSAGAAIAGAIQYAERTKRPQRMLIILHDSGNRYASKIYNNDWMVENGYLDQNYNVTLSDLVADNTEVKSLLETTPVSTALDTLVSNEVNQIAVVNADDHLLGVISTQDLIARISRNELEKDDVLSLAYHQNFTQLDQSTPLSSAIAHLSNDPIYLTQEGKLCGILHPKTILKYLSK